MKKIFLLIFILVGTSKLFGQNTTINDSISKTVYEEIEIRVVDKEILESNPDLPYRMRQFQWRFKGGEAWYYYSNYMEILEKNLRLFEDSKKICKKSDNYSRLSFVIWATSVSSFVYVFANSFGASTTKDGSFISNGKKALFFGIGTINFTIAARLGKKSHKLTLKAIDVYNENVRRVNGM